MKGEAQGSVWVFNGDNSTFPSGVFVSRALAESWISRHCLSGVLTEYPLDVGVYDWAVESGFFSPATDHQRTPSFIERFTSARMSHVHFDKGVSM